MQSSDRPASLKFEILRNKNRNRTWFLTFEKKSESFFRSRNQNFRCPKTTKFSVFEAETFVDPWFVLSIVSGMIGFKEGCNATDNFGMMTFVSNDFRKLEEDHWKVTLQPQQRVLPRTDLSSRVSSLHSLERHFSNWTREWMHRRCQLLQFTYSHYPVFINNQYKWKWKKGLNIDNRSPERVLFYFIFSLKFNRHFHWHKITIYWCHFNHVQMECSTD